jgi:hypothetical protein
VPQVVHGLDLCVELRLDGLGHVEHVVLHLRLDHGLNVAHPAGVCCSAVRVLLRPRAAPRSLSWAWYARSVGFQNHKIRVGYGVGFGCMPLSLRKGHHTFFPPGFLDLGRVWVDREHGIHTRADLRMSTYCTKPAASEHHPIRLSKEGDGAAGAAQPVQEPGRGCFSWRVSDVNSLEPDYD